MQEPIEFQSKAYVQATSYLSRALQAAPQLEFARRMLIATYLATSNPRRALETLPATFNESSSDAELLALAGQAHLQNGDNKRAQTLLARASKLDPNSAAKRTSLALAHLYGGKSEQALLELLEIARTDESATADAQLVGLYLRRGEIDKASAAVDRLEKKTPVSALPWHLRGTVQLAAKKVEAARKSFEKALELAPDFFPAAASLAQLDLADKKPEAAQCAFRGDPEARPEAACRRCLRSPKPKRVAGPGSKRSLTLLNSAVRASPTDVRPRQVLVDYYLRNDKPRLALTAAQAAVTDLPQGPELFDMLGRAQQAAGEMNQAIGTFKRLVALMPDSPQALMRLGNAYLADKTPELAQQTWRQALAMQPDFLDAQGALIQYHMQSGRVPDAHCDRAKNSDEATGRGHRLAQRG